MKGLGLLFSRPRWLKRKPRDALRVQDMAYVSPVAGAQVLEPAPAAMWAVYLLLALLATAVWWASQAQVDIVARANARVVPDGREQVIASLEGGLLRELLVREGQRVERGQPLAMLDPTRAEAQQAEGEAKRLALRATQARLQAEAAGRALSFPPDLPAVVTDTETESFEARRDAMAQALANISRSLGLLNKELAVAESMAAKGLMSEVEVIRLRRQVNELGMQSQDRVNRFRQEARGELVRVRTELSLMDEQMVVREDTVRRSTLVSPVRGFVKQIRNNTLGGVVAPGAPVMEIVPLGQHVMVEARVRPADIGFVQVGQPVLVKLTAYNFTTYGGLKGVVQSISPDALGDPERASAPDGTWYRALVRAESDSLPLPPAAASRRIDGSRSLPVLPGMTGTAEIRTGQRSVLGFMLQPLMRSQEAFRER